MTSYSYSQSNTVIDSLVQLLDDDLHDTTRYNVNYELFRKHYRRDIEKSKTYLDEEIRIAEKLSDPNRIAKSQNHLGIYFSVSSRYEDALKVFQNLIEQYRIEGNQERVSKSLTNVANAYRRLGKLKLALEAQMQALAIDESLGVQGNSLANNFFSIGNMHGEINNLTVSTDWYSKAAGIYKEIGNEEFYHRAKHMMGLNYMIEDSLVVARSNLEEVKAYYEKANLPFALSIALDNLGTVTEKEGDIVGAIDLFDQSLDIAKATNQLSLQGAMNQRIGELHLNLNDYKKAVDYAEKGLSISTQIKERRNIIANLNILMKAYDGLGDVPNAYRFQKRYLTLADSINTEDNKAALEEIEVKYQTEKKEQEILILEEKAKVDSLKQKGLLGGMFGLLGLIGALLYAMRQRKNRNILAKEKLDQELSFSQKELETKRQELTAFALQLANKNETLENIKRNVQEVRTNADDRRSIQSIVNTIDFNINDDNNWETFRQRFDAVHKDFESNVKSQYAKVTSNELRLMALLKMNLSSKEIANILNVSSDGIKKARYRLRKKLELQTSDSLEELVMAL